MPGLAILWEQWTGYLDASVRALCSRHPVRLLRAHVRPVPEAPFRPEDFIAAEQVYTFDSRPEQSELAALLERFQPDALLVASWHRPEYRRIARSFSGRATRIVGMDNQWHGTLKQWGGRLIAPFFVATHASVRCASIDAALETSKAHTDALRAMNEQLGRLVQRGRAAVERVDGA